SSRKISASARRSRMSRSFRRSSSFKCRRKRLQRRSATTDAGARVIDDDAQVGDDHYQVLHPFRLGRQVSIRVFQRRVAQAALEGEAKIDLKLGELASRSTILDA